MSDHETSCPYSHCPGVLRYDLLDRTNGFVARCEGTGRWSLRSECGSEYRWDAVHEEWEMVAGRSRSSR